MAPADETPKSELEEPPGSSFTLQSYPTTLAPVVEAVSYQATTQARTPRPTIWADIPDEKWDDWRWQLANRLNSLEELSKIINLTPEEIEGLTAESKFRVDITPYFASLIDPDDPHCPVRRQVIPLGRELQAFEGMMEDSLAEDKHSPVPGLVHRYPDRVLMLLTTQCATTAATARAAASWAIRGRTSAGRNSSCNWTTCAARRRCATYCSAGAIR